MGTTNGIFLKVTDLISTFLKGARKPADRKYLPTPPRPRIPLFGQGVFLIGTGVTRDSWVLTTALKLKKMASSIIYGPSLKNY